MKLPSTICGAALLAAAATHAAKNGLPVDKVYGVNIGSWLLSEPWMFPNEWQSMGGEVCNDCSQCAASEFALTKKLGQEQADKVFAQHWSTWFTQEHVNMIADAGLNTVRIPLGFWIVEGLVDRSNEYYPKGGMAYLKKGLKMLKAKGIHVLLDFHALPGVSSANQMFAGQCTPNVNFYNDENYDRALIWAAVMTAMCHIDPDFSSVFGIEAINEPEMDYNKTPGLGDYERKFVKVIRIVELALGITCPDADYTKLLSNATFDFTSILSGGILALSRKIDEDLQQILTQVSTLVTSICQDLGLPSMHWKRALEGLSSQDAAMRKNYGTPRLSSIDDLKQTLPESSGGTIPSVAGAVAGIAGEKRVPHGYSLERHLDEKRSHHKRGLYIPLLGANRKCLSTSFMNKDWQYNNPPNPADVAIGPQVYDAHLYFSFGGVADPNAQSYMQVICNTDRVSRATAENNRPMFFGEWSLATNFQVEGNFLSDWADAQKLIYAGQADGWIFWNFRVEKGSVYSPAWSYLDSLAAGYFTKDPSQLNNPDVCKPWMANTTTTTS
ncbi:Cellulase (glycosyl hydrolase family 5 protein) [Ceratobasidium sp. AG-Ba]|nr:Cellulase (glycosyl hydrolase family 5 protein) [Ceratobasidium sp. AG-Ba]